MRFKNELERNITIKLGYANAKVTRAQCRRARSAAAARSVQLTPLAVSRATRTTFGGRADGRP